MPLNLPAPSTTKLPRSPLTLVAFQVRHETSPDVSDAENALTLHTEVKSEYPVLEEQVGQSLTVVPGAAGIQTTAGAPSRGWRMRTDDGTWSAVTLPEFFSIETTRYDDWDDFRARIERFARAIHKATPISVEQRVGLRFIDQLRHPDVQAPRDWREWIAPTLLGPLSDDAVADHVLSTQHAFELGIGDGRSAAVRHGCLFDSAAKSWIYVLDYDCSIQRASRFSVDELLSVAENLHTLSLQLFQGSLTEKLLAYLGGHE